MTHQAISFIKSAVRIIGYILLAVNVPVAMLILVLSEMVGVYEEVGEK